jgi:8-oxo-dGTP pyrophosphatase MutT (NUDIX family)
VTRLPNEVFVVVRRGEEFLVVHRAPSGGAYWHGIAGGLEAGETYAEAAARELEEETGLVGQPVEIADPFVYAIADADPKYRAQFPGVEEIVVGCFLVDVPAGWEPELNGEHDDYRWCTRDDAVELLYWPEPKALLRSL